MSNGRGESEVLGNFFDGYQYSKVKLEQSLQEIMALRRQKPAKDAASTAKQEDVDLIVNELGVPKPHAEKVLLENGGDLTKALKALVMS